MLFIHITFEAFTKKHKFNLHHIILSTWMWKFQGISNYALQFFFYKVENIVGKKEENADYQHFLFFP